MAFPLIPVMAALGIAGVANQFAAGKKNQNYQDRLAKEQKIAARRAAIERAMGGTSISRMSPDIAPPDTSNYATLAGLSNLGSSLIMQKYG